MDEASLDLAIPVVQALAATPALRSTAPEPDKAQGSARPGKPARSAPGA